MPARPDLTDIKSLTPFFAGYSAASIRHWRTREVNSIPKLDQVILQEWTQRPGKDGFGFTMIPRYRVLELDEAGLYQIRVFTQLEEGGDGGFIEEPTIQPMPSGTRIDYIPFIFLNPGDLMPDVSKSPLIDLADVNKDGKPDILAGGYLGDDFIWYRSNGDGNFARVVIDASANGAHSLVAGDVDGDGDNDLLSAWQDGNTIAWYENKGNDNFTWHAIDTNARRARAVIATDLDKDGDMDALAASVDNDSVVWHRNDGKGNFSRVVVDNKLDGAYGLFVVDMNKDGKLDILATARMGHQVVLYRRN